FPEMIFPRYLTSSVEIECSSRATRSFCFSTIYLLFCRRVSRGVSIIVLGLQSSYSRQFIGARGWSRLNLSLFCNSEYPEITTNNRKIKNFMYFTVTDRHLLIEV